MVAAVCAGCGEEENSSRNPRGVREAAERTRGAETAAENQPKGFISHNCITLLCHRFFFHSISFSGHCLYADIIKSITTSFCMWVVSTCTLPSFYYSLSISFPHVLITQGTISVGVDATDLFDRYDEDFEELPGGGFPHIEINKMHISQSIEV